MITKHLSKNTNKAITPKQFNEEMKEIQNTSGGDEEIAHKLMDDLIAKTLTELGYNDGIAILKKKKKWYA